MSELLSCKFNIDTACVELRYADGEVLSIYTPGIEGSFDTTIAMRAEMVNTPPRDGHFNRPSQTP